MTYELAQLNIAHAKLGDPHGPEMANFWAETARINALADQNEGLVWRLQDSQTGNASTFEMPGQDRMMVNLSVWRDVKSLHAFIYRAQHAEIMARKAEWFVEEEEAHMVLWWVLEGHRPSLEECWERLSLLRANGPTAEAFSFKKRFDPPK